jgi:hypothetical protein
MNLLLPPHGLPGYTVVQTGNGHGTSSTGAMSVTSIPAGVTLIVVAVAWSGAGGATITDSSGNTSYLSSTTYSNTSVNTKLLYKVNPSTTASMTFTVTAANVSAVVLVCTGSTIPTPALDQSNGSNTNGTSVNTGNITPTFNGELVVASGATGTSSTGSPGTIAGWTLIHVPFAAGVSQGIAVYYQVQTAAATTSITFAGTTPKYFGVTIVSFKN